MSLPASAHLPVFLAASLALTLPGRVHAQGAAAAANPSAKEYVLARKSSFEPATSSRNPFWPIGWTPAPVVASEAIVDVQATEFKVTSTSIDYPALAVINGRTYGIGEQVPVAAHPGQFVTVKQVLDGAVVLDYHGHALRATSR